MSRAPQRRGERLPAILLIVGSASILLWARSYYHSDNLSFGRSSGTTTFYSERCAFYFSHTRDVATNSRGFTYEDIPYPFYYQCFRAGVYVEIWSRFEWRTERTAIVGIPYWAIALPLIVCNAIQVICRRWTRRTRTILLGMFALWPMWYGQVIYEPSYYDDEIARYLAAVLIAILLLLARDRRKRISDARPRVWQWRLRQQLRRQRLGLCITCGYDLRFLKNCCPECGTTISGNPG